MQVYRNLRDSRVLVTHADFDPEDQTTAMYLEKFGSNPLYIRLWRSQRIFRVRLNPKPWRINLPRTLSKFPRETSEQKDAFKQRLLYYQQDSKPHDICRLLRESAPKPTDRAIIKIIEVHDRYCLNASAKSLV